MTRATVVTALLACLALPGAAIAAPPPGTDLTSPLHVWFDHQFSLRGAWCCNVSDGHVLDDSDWEATATGYRVRIAGDWLAIPPEAMRDPKGGPNPTGHAVVWFTRAAPTEPPVIYCFAPGTLY